MAVGTTMDAPRRRLVYGVNVAVSSILALLLLILAVYVAGRFKGQVDLTSSGMNSLSPRTVRLLRGLEQDVTITAIYTVLTEYDKIAQKRQDTVRDLLSLYESASRGRVATFMIEPMKEQARVTALLDRLREKPAYKDEAQPHAAALTKFAPLNEQVLRLITSEVEQLKGFQALPHLSRVRELAIIRFNMERALQETDAVNTDIGELVQGGIPRYGQAIEAARKLLTQVRTTLKESSAWMAEGGLALPGLGPEIQSFFSGATGRYEQVLAEIEALDTQTRDLKRVKLEGLYDKLTRWPDSPPIVVETPSEAQVLDLQEVWPYRTDPNAPPSPDNDPRDFAGEQAVSSALLQLTQKDKTAVVFTRYGGPSPIRPDFSQMNPMMRQMPRAPYQALNQRLEEENFLTEDWDVSVTKQPPAVADAGRMIYVIFPPLPPPQPDPRRPSPQAGITPADIEIIQKAVSESGMALFLTGWAQPTSPMMPLPGTYEFADYLKTTWGIDVQYRYLALQFAASPQDTGLWVPANRDPLLVVTPLVRFTDHPITKPLQALPGAFHTVCPLRIMTGEDQPAGVTTAVVAEITDTEDVWAFDSVMRVQEDLQQNQGTRRRAEDIAAPFPVAVSATNEQDQRIVVFASESFSADDVAQAKGVQLTSNGLQAYTFYPANTDLFINTLHWLTGEADRIAVGPRRADVPRLDELKEGGTATFCRVFLVGIWPAVTLVVGGGVWMFRRR
ncbi:MAG: Gldg family protein [Planctomycetes bacterium]|nr:Gldg family protein [Planctomycetota bacterium]